MSQPLFFAYSELHYCGALVILEYADRILSVRALFRCPETVRKSFLNR